ncbi:unnamed protein product, partial [Amoebophrya sp. A25]
QKFFFNIDIDRQNEYYLEQDEQRAGGKICVILQRTCTSSTYPLKETPTKSKPRWCLPLVRTLRRNESKKHLQSNKTVTTTVQLHC